MALEIVVFNIVVLLLMHKIMAIFQVDEYLMTRYRSDVFCSLVSFVSSFFQAV